MNSEYTFQMYSYNLLLHLYCNPILFTQFVSILVLYADELMENTFSHKILIFLLKFIYFESWRIYSRQSKIVEREKMWRKKMWRHLDWVAHQTSITHFNKLKSIKFQLEFLSAQRRGNFKFSFHHLLLSNMERMWFSAMLCCSTSCFVFSFWQSNMYDSRLNIKCA